MGDDLSDAAPPQARARGGGFLSTTFDQPVGAFVDPLGVRGYYLDMTVKAVTPSWPPPELDGVDVWVATAQWGLGAHERHLAGRDDAWLKAAVAAGEHLMASQEGSGPLAGGLVHRKPYPHTFRLDPPWLSAMAQGEAASLFVRLHAATGDERFAAAARAALGPLRVPSSEGGVRALIGGAPFPEEYPTTPSSYVLNGGIFSLWGLYDVATALGDAGAAQEFAEGLEALAANAGRWDTGYWSRYDLYPHRLTNVASVAYHQLHIDQLTAMALIAPRPELDALRSRFEGYSRSRICRARALASKVAFRLAVPRRRAAT